MMTGVLVEKGETVSQGVQHVMMEAETEGGSCKAGTNRKPLNRGREPSRGFLGECGPASTLILDFPFLLF